MENFIFCSAQYLPNTEFTKDDIKNIQPVNLNKAMITKWLVFVCWKHTVILYLIVSTSYSKVVQNIANF